MDMPEAPLYNFGYGLSYTDFKYSNLKLSKSTCSKDDQITVSVDVTNTGDREGAEVVQLYVNDVVRSVMAPVKELKGFKKEFIAPGQTKTIEIPLKVSELSFVNEDEKTVLEPGDFTIMVGPDSRDAVLLKTTLRLEDTLNKQQTKDFVM